MIGTDPLLARSIRAMSWSYAGVAVNVLLQIAASVIFARVLGARITGVFAFGLLVFPPFRFLCEFGLGSALIAQTSPGTAELLAAFSRSLLLAVLSATAWMLCIRMLAASVHQQEQATALASFALVLLTLPVQSVCAALLTKRLAHKELQTAAVVSYAFGYLGVGAYGAFHGWGVWSLVLGFIAQNLIATAFLGAITRPSLHFDLTGDFRLLWSFGARITAINVSNWLTSSLDNMAVAWFFGTRTLGIYSVAYGLVRTPADKIVTTLQGVLFPAAVLAQTSRERMTRGCLAAIEAVFVLTAPAFCAVAVLSKTLVDVLYGSNWADASLVLPPFALSMACYCLTTVVSALLWGGGGVSRDLRVQWTTAILFFVAIIIAARSSFIAVAWTVLPVSALRMTWVLRALMSILDIPLRRVLQALRSGTVLLLSITPVLCLLDVILGEHGVAAATRLGWEAAVGIALWSATVLFLHARLMTPELSAGIKSIRLAWYRQ